MSSLAHSPTSPVASGSPSAIASPTRRKKAPDGEPELKAWGEIAQRLAIRPNTIAARNDSAVASHESEGRAARECSREQPNECAGISESLGGICLFGRSSTLVWRDFCEQKAARPTPPEWRYAVGYGMPIQFSPSNEKPQERANALSNLAAAVQKEQRAF
jgi:hypothetical protein